MNSAEKSPQGLLADPMLNLDNAVNLVLGGRSDFDLADVRDKIEIAICNIRQIHNADKKSPKLSDVEERLGEIANLANRLATQIEELSEFELAILRSHTETQLKKETLQLFRDHTGDRLISGSNLNFSPDTNQLLHLTIKFATKAESPLRGLSIAVEGALRAVRGLVPVRQGRGNFVQRVSESPIDFTVHMAADLLFQAGRSADIKGSDGKASPLFLLAEELWSAAIGTEEPGIAERSTRLARSIRARLSQDPPQLYFFYKDHRNKRRT